VSITNSSEAILYKSETKHKVNIFYLTYLEINNPMKLYYIRVKSIFVCERDKNLQLEKKYPMKVYFIRVKQKQTQLCVFKRSKNLTLMKLYFIRVIPNTKLIFFFKSNKIFNLRKQKPNEAVFNKG
jgi:hypothetical protein